MAGSLNEATLIGNLGKDPEVRTLQNGTKVVNFNMATSESWKDKATGERKEKTDWHRIVIWGPLADVAEKYLHRGSKVYIAGKLQTREWTDKDDIKRYTTEVVVQGYGGKLILLDKAGGSAAPAHPGPEDTSAWAPKRDPNFPDDDIPF